MARPTSLSFWTRYQAFLPLAVAISLIIPVKKSLYSCLVKPPTATCPPERPFRHRHLVYETSYQVGFQPALNTPEQRPIVFAPILARYVHQRCKSFTQIS